MVVLLIIAIINRVSRDKLDIQPKLPYCAAGLTTVQLQGRRYKKKLELYFEKQINILK